MEENRERIKALLDQATPLRKAPIDLSNRVLSQWKTEQEAKIVWKPLISKRAWFIIGTSFILLTIWLLNMGAAPGAPSRFGEFLQRLSFNFDLPTLSPNPVILASVLALALMVGFSAVKMNLDYKVSE